MSFEDTVNEARERFSEAFQIINFLDANEGAAAAAATNTQKALRGLCLVSIYAAVERSVNSTVEQALAEISSHSTPSASCTPSVLSLFHFGSVQAIRDCGMEKTIPKAILLLSNAFSQNPISAANNPPAILLQNVDGSSIIAVAGFFGLSNYTIPGNNIARLNNLRERRNAVSHGRESASDAGEPFTINELRNVYNCADQEVTRFIEAMKNYCMAKEYVAA